MLRDMSVVFSNSVGILLEPNTFQVGEWQWLVEVSLHMLEHALHRSDLDSAPHIVCSFNAGGNEGCFDCFFMLTSCLQAAGSIPALRRLRQLQLRMQSSARSKYQQHIKTEFLPLTSPQITDARLRHLKS
jgi:hypothetical protein